MMTAKPKRIKFSEEEKIVILEEFSLRKDILIPKSGRYRNTLDRQRAWEEITSAVNSLSPLVQRTPDEVRKKWKNMILDARKELASAKHPLLRRRPQERLLHHIFALFNKTGSELPEPLYVAAPGFRTKAPASPSGPACKVEGFLEPVPSLVLRPPAGGLELRTPAGGLELRTPAGGLELRTPAGGLELRTPAGGLELRTPAGGLELRTPAGGLELRTPAGGLELRTPSGGLELRTPGGGLELRPPAGGLELRTPAGVLEPAPDREALCPIEVGRKLDVWPEAPGKSLLPPAADPQARFKEDSLTEAASECGEKRLLDPLKDLPLPAVAEGPGSPGGPSGDVPHLCPMPPMAPSPPLDMALTYKIKCPISPLLDWPCLGASSSPVPPSGRLDSLSAEGIPAAMDDNVSPSVVTAGEDLMPGPRPSVEEEEEELPEKDAGELAKQSRLQTEILELQKETLQLQKEKILLEKEKLVLEIVKLRRELGT